MPDHYLSEDVSFQHRYLVILYWHDGRIRKDIVEANCIVDAVIKVAPGNELAKVEVIIL